MKVQLTRLQALHAESYREMAARRSASGHAGHLTASYVKPLHLMHIICRSGCLYLVWKEGTMMLTSNGLISQREALSHSWDL